MNDAITLEKNKVSVKEVGYLFIKRLFDIICGLLGCILILPIAIVVKIAYVCNKDFASIFYSQIRIGKTVRNLSYINLDQWFLMQMKY